MANYVGSKFGQADHEKLVSFRPLSWRVINVKQEMLSAHLPRSARQLLSSEPYKHLRTNVNAVLPVSHEYGSLLMHLT